MSSGGWELSKENIQPLSSGRRMAYLAESLPTLSGANDQQQEAHHWEQIGKLEEIAEKQAGDDPLQAWIDLIRYIQQHFPVMNAKVNAKFKDTMRKAVQLNINEENYKNDRRYVELVLKSVEVMPDVTQQLNTLRCVLDGGIGDLVSSMYIRLSEIYEGYGDEKNASEILRRGIQKNAEPKCSLEEMLTHIQNRWAEKYAKTLEDGPSGDSHGMRNFASSVPTVGRNNEAITIRRDLPPAAPATDRHNNKMPPTRVHVYNEENAAPYQVNERDNLQQNAATNGLFSMERADYDRENHLEPTRWNAGSTHLDNPALPEPPEKLKLFEEEPVSHYPASKLEKPHDVNKRALKERTEVTEETHPQLNTDGQNPSKPGYQSRNLSGVSHVSQNNAEESEDFDKKDVFEDIKYKPLVPGRRKANRMMMKAMAYLKEREEKQKQTDLENREKTLLRNEVEKLNEKVKVLEEKLKDQFNLNELKLMQKEEKIKQLELGNESLMNQLTQLSTSNNIRESQFHREKNSLVEEINELKSKLTKSNELENELNYYKKQCEVLLEEKMAREAEVQKDNMSESDYEHVVVEMKPMMVNVDVQRNVNYVSSSSGEQCTAEISRFHSGENTIAANSFLPDLGNANSIGYNQSVHERKGLLDNHKGNDMMMNITPVAPPDDFDIPPPCFNNFGIKKLSLYESVSESFSKPNPYKVNLFANNKRNDVIKTLHMLPENLPPQQQGANACQDPMGAAEPAFVPHEETTPEPIQSNQNFLRPVLPSRKSIVSFPMTENVRPTTETASKNPVYSRGPVSESYYSSQPRYYGANGNDSDSDEEIMIRRHQQTGVDLNISNLTCALSLGPRPLTNSTPEKKKNLPTNNFQLYTEEPTASEVQNGASRMSRYNSVLNDPDPAINLSTIQETSRENRSRSTTSSSSGNYTASTTRFGMATSTTQLCNNVTRSSSIPRSNSHISQLYSNGYYSDTNGK